ncbi:MAG: rod-binding protein [Gemmatimonadota bacterium]
MTNINEANPISAPVPDRDQRLKKVVGQLQGVFVEQLFKAMRETVPTDGVTDGGPGEAMFSGMMDQHLADALPGQWEHGIGESLYRQLRPQLSRSTGPETPDGTR